MYLISQNYRDKLCYSGKYQVSVQSFLILSTTTGQTEILFYVIYVSFHRGPDLVGIIPFLCTAEHAGICA